MFTCMYVFTTPNNNNNNSCQDTINYETFFVTVWVPVPITEKACSWGDLWFFFLSLWAHITVTLVETIYTNFLINL